jgi:DNA-binding MarR family transcriptional regulator/N-acetylglutamate synthase-like GNAT family acetyltransferase
VEFAVADGALATRITAVRRFNRCYTQKIGVLGERLLDSPFSLTEARILYELAHRERPTASELCRELDLDPGYLSRVLGGFRRRGLVVRAASDTDRRQIHLSLSEAGQAAFAPLDRRSRDEIAALLARLPELGQRRLVAAMAEIERLLGPASAPREPYLLRPPVPGDIGWVISRHGGLYAQEYGFDWRFEALVAEIAAKFVAAFEPRRECCWIAERDGEPVGSVFLVKESEQIAKLRLLLVEPAARGLGIGARLVAETIRFARRSGYQKITLWTQSLLVAARHIYETAGFRLVASEPHHSFGHDLVGEHWELAL